MHYDQIKMNEFILMNEAQVFVLDDKGKDC